MTNFSTTSQIYKFYLQIRLFKSSINCKKKNNLILYKPIYKIIQFNIKSI